MSTPITGITSTTSTPGSSTSGGALKGMGASDFLNLMITQLQHQDPMNPTDSNQLLTQMSQISALQSNSQMQQSLSGLTLQQSIGAGGNLIGKTVQGIDANGNQVKGIVTSITVQNQQVFLELDSAHELPMGNVTSIAATSAVSASALASAVPQLQALMQNSSGSSASSLSNLAAVLSALGVK